MLTAPIETELRVLGHDRISNMTRGPLMHQSLCSLGINGCVSVVDNIYDSHFYACEFG